VILATRRFTVSDQDWFARASGDFNPIHVDPRWAERHFPGALVVHGVHTVLWALDQAFAAGAPEADAVSATFVKPVLVGDEVAAEADAELRILRVLVRGEPVAVVKLGRDTASPGPSPDASEGPRGSIRAPDEARRLVERFPDAAGALGPAVVKGLAALSTLVGMECPGRDSMLSELKVRRSDAPGEALAYGLHRREPAFSRVELAVEGFGLAGTVSAFAGKAETQAGPAPVEGLVPTGAFRGQTPLVIGATSGLGAATARLLAAGGATPVLTYREESGAAEVLREVCKVGDFRAIAFDVSAPAAGLAALAREGWEGEQLYYFASPRIFRRRLEPYQRSDLDAFLRVYVDGFYETIRGLMHLRPGAGLSVFFPSTTALDDNTAELFEYRLAKSAGEELCQRLQRRYRTLKITVVRLPRIETRQTRSFVRVAAQAPEEVMAPYVRELQASGRRP
jgi:NAD(P)-dependent dehydrogenase (short-subunit alcohol dehydrogenase family)